MINLLILGTIQGIVEWLPVSSEGILVLIQTNFLGGGSLEQMVKQALFLHLGTFFAALVYFRKEVASLFKAGCKKRLPYDSDKKVLDFLAVSTVISGLAGIFLLNFLKRLSLEGTSIGKVLNLFIGLMLLVTAFVQIKSGDTGERKEKDLSLFDAICLGLVQGLAAIPGLSRSGVTVSTFLFLGFEKTIALKLSFLMSLPIVFFGNLILNWRDFSLGFDLISGFLTSFIFGLSTIKFLLRLAKKVNFGYFVLFFAILTLVSAII